MENTNVPLVLSLGIGQALGLSVGVVGGSIISGALLWR